MLMKQKALAQGKVSYWSRFAKDMRINWSLYLMFLPILVYYIIFCYAPMYGATIAFKEFNPIKGIIGSEWVGFKHFIDFFSSTDFKRLMANTLRISITGLVVGFPMPIILALMINEVQHTAWKRTVQTITYLPHFVSLVVVCGIIKSFVARNGLITFLLSSAGMVKNADLLANKNYFLPIYLISDIWQSVGWGSIIYLAALTGINQELYEAASIDGAGKIRQLFAVTLPGIAPTVVIMLILAISGLMGLGSEKVILLYNPLIYEKADIISSYVYRRGLLEFNFSYSSAVGMFNAVINFILIQIGNAVSRKVNETSLW